MQPPHGRDLKPTRAEAEEAVRTLIRWAGDNPSREGLKDTPGRVVRAYGEWFSGYGEEPDELLQRTFEEVGGYDEVVILRDIAFHSYCEHHMAPISGKAQSGICRINGWSGSPSWSVSSMLSPSAFRYRSG